MAPFQGGNVRLQGRLSGYSGQRTETGTQQPGPEPGSNPGEGILPGANEEALGPRPDLDRSSCLD